MNTYRAITYIAIPLTFVVLTILVALMADSAGGIIPLDGGNGFTSGNGVIVCGEVVTLNATEDISDDHLRAMFEQALIERNTTCANLMSK